MPTVQTIVQHFPESGHPVLGQRWQRKTPSLYLHCPRMRAVEIWKRVCVFCVCVSYLPVFIFTAGSWQSLRQYTIFRYDSGGTIEFSFLSSCYRVPVPSVYVYEQNDSKNHNNKISITISSHTLYWEVCSCSNQWNLAPSSATYIHVHLNPRGLGWQISTPHRTYFPNRVESPSAPSLSASAQGGHMVTIFTCVQTMSGAL